MRKMPARATFVVGPEKTATTFIQTLLECHPDVRLPRGIKETFFFERFFDNGLDWYLIRFDLDGDAPHLVEVAPGCFCEEDAIARIKASFPDARIVICAREPVARTISHYNHMRRYGYLNTPLEANLDTSEKPLKASLYSHYCPMWEAAFGAENVKMLDMAELVADPRRFADMVFDAVGVRRIAVPERVLGARVNEATEPRNFIVARLATTISNAMKKRGLYRLLDMVRNSPVHALVYGNRRPEQYDRPEVVARLSQMLQGERAYLQKRYGLTYMGEDSGSAAD